MPLVKRSGVGVIALIILGGVLPLAVYWLLLGRVPTLMPAAALAELNQPGATAVLVDVRPVEAFVAWHVEGAVNFPPSAWTGLASAAALPAALNSRPLLLICDSGWQSAQAVLRLQAAGVAEVYTVRGGLQEWPKAAARAALNRKDFAYQYFVRQGQVTAPPSVSLSLADQASQAAAFLLIKPVYTLLSLALFVLLLRQPAPDLAALRWALLAFFIGEMFCYFNILAFGDDSYLSEYLHSLGMIVSFGFLFHALLEGVDLRVVHIGALGRGCALYPLCGGCPLAEGRTCRAWRLAQLAVPVLALLCAVPLVARLDLQGYMARVFTLPYYYTRFAVYQAYENTVLPLLALACFGAAYVPLWLPVREPFPALTRVLVSAGGGALSFALVRLSLGMIFTSNLVWFNFWEETTELVYILAVAAALWTFRQALFPGKLGDFKFSLD
jgi:rhodanese-related sulfurtransferase